MPAQSTAKRDAPAFTLEPLPASFGAVVTGLRLAELSERAFRSLHAAWLEYGLLIFPGQHLSRDEQIALARRFGPLEYELGALSNLDPDGAVRPSEAGAEDDVVKVLKGNMGWHQDSTYMPVQAKGAVFSAVTVPSEGGGTAFADMAAAYEALSEEEQRRLEGLTALHSLIYSQGKVGHFQKEGSAYPGYGLIGGEPRRRPLVKVHPETGRKALAIGRHAYATSGMDEDESEAFLARLVDEACRPPRVWAHAWSLGDVVAWDNRRLLHRGLPWDMREPRVMWHSRLAGDPATESAL
jgi:alpha-ketoglutarate-dependent taurine dioxygenase